MGPVITFIILGAIGCLAAVGFFGFAIADVSQPMPTIQDSSLVNVLQSENDRVSRLFFDCQQQIRNSEVIEKNGKYYRLIELEMNDLSKDQDFGI